jgi:hypothetical protein
MICTALSHDVVAHETTHALLDALRSSFMIPTNVDVPAFHEGFSDLVALFLHFSYADVVERAISQWYGGSREISLLTDLAREFGYARSKSGQGKALRSGVDLEGIAAFDSDVDPAHEQGPKRYDPKLESHALGSVLVSAVFEAFVTVAKRKTERLFRIAGVDPRDLGKVALGEALVKALAQEASLLATQFLNICIRAIDYCPPVDLEFGEYLRALITADSDIEAGDKWGAREALMRSFRRRDIFPCGVAFMTEDAVRWQSPDRPLRIPALAFKNLRFDGEPGRPATAKEMERQARALGRFVTHPEHAEYFRIIAPDAPLPKGIKQASPARVESIRVSRRVTPSGSVLFDLVAEVTQSCTAERNGELFEVNGGCTVLIDPQGDVRYIIAKGFKNGTRSARQHAAMRGPLKKLWKKSGRRFVQQANLLQIVHKR